MAGGDMAEWLYELYRQLAASMDDLEKRVEILSERVEHLENRLREIEEG